MVENGVSALDLSELKSGHPAAVALYVRSRPIANVSAPVHDCSMNARGNAIRFAVGSAVVTVVIVLLNQVHLLGLPHPSSPIKVGVAAGLGVLAASIVSSRLRSRRR